MAMVDITLNSLAPHWPLLAASMLYLFQAGNYFLILGNKGLGIALTAYAVANAGLIIAALETQTS